MFALAALLFGEVFVLAGVALAFGYPAALIVAGLQLVAVGLLRSEGDS